MRDLWYTTVIPKNPHHQQETNTITAVKYKVSRSYHSHQKDRYPHKITFDTGQDHQTCSRCKPIHKVLGNGQHMALLAQSTTAETFWQHVVIQDHPLLAGQTQMTLTMVMQITSTITSQDTEGHQSLLGRHTPCPVVLWLWKTLMRTDV